MEVRRATEADAPALVDGLARAFAPQPFTRWMCGEDLAKEARSIEVEFKHAFRFGLVYTTYELTGAAIWHPPDVPPGYNLSYFWDQFRVLGVGAKTLGQVWELYQVERRHPQQPHYYLAVLAVFPECQGQGIGSALLQPMLARCDAEGMPAYLLTDTELNVRFYRKHGFTVLWENTIGKGAFMAWGMWREPVRESENAKNEK